MSTIAPIFTAVDPATLTAVCGGATANVDVAVPGAKVGLDVNTATPANPQAKDPSAYLRCLDLVGKQGGMFEAPNDMAARQKALCTPLLGK